MVRSPMGSQAWPLSAINNLIFANVANGYGYYWECCVASSSNCLTFMEIPPQICDALTFCYCVLQHITTSPKDHLTTACETHLKSWKVQRLMKAIKLILCLSMSSLHLGLATFSLWLLNLKKKSWKVATNCVRRWLELWIVVTLQKH